MPVAGKLLETAMKHIAPLILLASVSVLASCQSERSQRPLPPIQQSNTIEGSWVDPNGIVSTFAAGAFTTRSTDSNTLLASGNYTRISDRMVEINMTSLVRNTQSKVNCSMVTATQLNCTTDSGAQFSLTRRA